MGASAQAAYLPRPNDPYWCYQACIAPNPNNHNHCVAFCYGHSFSSGSELNEPAKCPDKISD